ncbi:TIGR04283 family arsenosugar biosynthesis glycosyltransferase [Methyloceanibacter sp.]|uniref:TIGR04283 family arsenosugar biosynthesis glycosyltransferase n=1 Tax=Methyloceanibacter sp. TaxID=1965321 RepID=UPI0020876A56|nr:TIGR04283 family arsenosugar biosynthesis glycosyltransferase [Methyloceanibacter sp.]GFO82782.1 MAG: glycosyl transferase [Methyloceanibacter sp.]HML90923.1 TIGR04283 family arsenosugar biosynthesis glycosyltransferase [Methyloceanibacter sp.]
MISVVIPTLNAERTLVPTLSGLVPAVVEGIVQEAIIADGGSTDGTDVIADAAGTHLVKAPRGRGMQLEAGAREAKGDWLLFLHADTVLEPGWAAEAANFIERIESGRRPLSAAYFRFGLDDEGFMPRLIETMVGLRCAFFSLPYGDQGLLISRTHYARLGGFRPLPLMEDVDLVRRLKRRELHAFRTRAVTSARRYQEEGYLSRSIRNLGLTLLYLMRVPPRVLARLYE